MALSGPVLRQRIGARSLVGPRDVNQDKFVLHDVGPDGGDLLAVVGVADGMGGMNAGEVASDIAIGEVVAALQGHMPDVESLRAAVVGADAKVRELDGAGTTLTVCAISGHEALIAHVGDTRAYLLHGEELTQITDDHSLVGRLVREGTIAEDDALGHPDQNVLERALGAGPIADVDVYRVALGPGDVLLVSSDGMHGTLTSDVIRSVLLSTSSLQEACETLTAMAEQLGSQDNITAVAWQFPAAPTAHQPMTQIGARAPENGGGAAAMSIDWLSLGLVLAVVFALSVVAGLGLAVVL